MLVSRDPLHRIASVVNLEDIYFSTTAPQQDHQHIPASAAASTT
jgi:hypothetical protein